MERGEIEVKRFHDVGQIGGESGFSMRMGSDEQQTHGFNSASPPGPVVSDKSNIAPLNGSYKQIMC